MHEPFRTLDRTVLHISFSSAIVDIRSVYDSTTLPRRPPLTRLADALATSGQGLFRATGSSKHACKSRRSQKQCSPMACPRTRPIAHAARRKVNPGVCLVHLQAAHLGQIGSAAAEANPLRPALRPSPWHPSSTSPSASSAASSGLPVEGGDALLRGPFDVGCAFELPKRGAMVALPQVEEQMPIGRKQVPPTRPHAQCDRDLLTKEKEGQVRIVRPRRRVSRRRRRSQPPKRAWAVGVVERQATARGSEASRPRQTPRAKRVQRVVRCGPPERDDVPVPW